MAAQRGLAGLPWRGAILTVRAVPGRGGASGVRFEVAMASLPSELQARIRSTRLPPAPRVKPEHARVQAMPCPRSEADLRLSAVLAVRAAGPIGSPARAARVAELVASLRYLSGDRAGRPVAERTIRAWVAEYEKAGLAAVKRKRRADRGLARVIAWRAWDDAMEAAGVPIERQREIASRLDALVRGHWKAGAASAANIQFDMAPECRDLALAAGVTQEGPAMAALCRIPLHYIGARERRRARVEHIRKADAAKWAADHVSRVRRNRGGLRPMDLVAADVRHSDILYARPDGSHATAKMVAFLDLATNRLFGRAFLLPKGQMIRREHVLTALRDMMADPAWGVPRGLYFDNGGEFRVGAAADDLAHIAAMARTLGAVFDARDAADLSGEPGVINSEAYNPQSKVIESVFSAFTRSIEASYPGFVGGDRMAKKTTNQGRAPVPMRGSEAEVLAAYDEMVAFWNAKPQQRGAIAGRSPDKAFAAFVAGGWQAVTLDPGEFALAFGKDTLRQVKRGGELDVNGIAFRHDMLAAMVGESVRVRVPILDPSRIVVMDDKGAPLCVAREVESYGFRDLAGAGERKRRLRAGREAAQAAAAGAADVDLRAARARAMAALPPPAAPTPQAVVSLHPVLKAAATEPAQAPSKPAATRQSRQLEAFSEHLALAGQRRAG